MIGKPSHASSYRLPKKGVPSIAKRLLIVDDDEDVRNLLKIFLCRLGYDVASANNGSEALNLFNQFSCDLVITDLQMPVMDGYQLITNLRTQSPRTPVVVISGHGPQSGDQEQCLATAYAILGKPFRLESVESVVRNALSE